MFVLMSLMSYCLQRANALAEGIYQPSAPVKWAHNATDKVAKKAPNPTAPLHAPIPRLIV
jgi:hypothetical protein